LRKLARFFSLPTAERARTVEAAVSLLIVRLVLGLLPFARALKVLRVSSGDGVRGRIAASEARDISRAIARAARHVPFRAVCLQQAFAALLMLRRRGLAATVHLGVTRSSTKADLEAHAWSRSGDVAVTGAALAPGFTPVAAFAA
jgi:hypothetical protein